MKRILDSFLKYEKTPNIVVNRYWISVYNIDTKKIECQIPSLNPNSHDSDHARNATRCALMHNNFITAINH